MSDQNPIVVPDFLDIDADTVSASSALVAGNGGYLTPPATARESKDEKGNVYKRWSEGVVIEATWRDVTKKEKPEERLLTVIVQLKVRAGFPNQHQRTWTRYFLSPQMLAKKAPAKDSHENMHERAIGAIASLLKATGYMPTSGVLTGKLLNHMFPQGKGNKSAPICGKEVTANFSDSPNTGQGAVSERQTHADSFLPYAPPAPVAEKK